MNVRQYNMPEPERPPQRTGMTFLESLWVLGMIAMGVFIAYSADAALRANQEILNSKLDSLCELHVECLEWREEKDG